MELLFKGLKKNEIISSRNLNDIRQYISKKHPDLPSKERSHILANSINSILDKNIPPIDGIDNKTVRSRVLAGALGKKSFSVNAYEIFENCLPHIENREENIVCITEWVNSHQDAAVSRDEIETLISPGSAEELPIEIIPTEDQYEAPEIACSEFQYEYERKPKLLFSNIYNNKAVLASSIALFLLAMSLLAYSNAYSKEKAVRLLSNTSTNAEDSVSSVQSESERPISLHYRDVNKDKLKAWLNKKDSMLTEEPYFSVIINTAQKYDINPLFLVAITGQEQAFVPRSADNSKAIANNPFNVYGSWKDYNTDISDSAEIAAKTIVSLSKDKPMEVDAIQWINRKYAEDANWHVGVTLIFNQLSREVGN